jgi:preprotein translocase subunit SecD
MNKYPLWKNILLLIGLAIGCLYAIPNIFSSNPAIQISSTTPGLALTAEDVKSVKRILSQAKLSYKSVLLENKSVWVRFLETDSQMQAEPLLKKGLGDQYITALNLESATPTWLMRLGAYPMKQGLDLRGGVHFLLQVDVDSVRRRRIKSDIRNVGEELRHKKVRYTGIAVRRQKNIRVQFRDLEQAQRGVGILTNSFPEYTWEKRFHVEQRYEVVGELSPLTIEKMGQYTMEQTMATLRRRVNELGVSEAVVQQQGRNRVSVDLPGVQDATQAKDILGKTATLEFHLVDSEHDLDEAANGIVPIGFDFYTYRGYPVLLKNRVLLSGESITHATSGFDQNGRPSVSIRLEGGGGRLFGQITSENIGRSLAVVYIETHSERVEPTTKTEGAKRTTQTGEAKIIYKKIKRVISVATIQSALGSNFQITGLSSVSEANNLALLLRAGSLPAAATIVEERTIGPSMGKRNIKLGRLSIEIGLLAVVLFMLFYYRLFGLIADMGLVINLVFLVALLSLLGATLTFPGIAGILLTLGMAVDYNVLIYERIREELRNGVTSQAAIHAGYEKAFTTIIDANITTLIVGLILFALGSGPVKGFAITLVIGLFTSIISSVTYTRAIVNWIYGGRRVETLSVGIKQKRQQEKGN